MRIVSTNFAKTLACKSEHCDVTKTHNQQQWPLYATDRIVFAADSSVKSAQTHLCKRLQLTGVTVVGEDHRVWRRLEQRVAERWQRLIDNCLTVNDGDRRLRRLTASWTDVCPKSRTWKISAAVTSMFWEISTSKTLTVFFRTKPRKIFKKITTTASGTSFCHRTKPFDILMYKLCAL